MRARRIAAALVASFAAVLLAQGSAAAAPAPFGLSCVTQESGLRFCAGNGTSDRVPSWDGTPLDVDVTLPASGDGPFPTIVMLHGWGNDKRAFLATDAEGAGYNAGAGLYPAVTHNYNTYYYARQGYAVLTYSARGKGKSCGGGGGPPAQLQTGACADGFIRLADQRYEVRDTQHLLGLLVDQGVTDPGAIGVTGISYGGGQSLELAYLKDRIRCPGASPAGDPCEGVANGEFVPWRSPAGVPLSIGAAHPRWFWSDLVDALTPNGRFLDFDNSTAAASRAPLGVKLESFVDGLYASGYVGSAGGYYVAPQPPGSPDSPWDLTSFLATWSAGEPYGDDAAAIADELYQFHQGFGIPASEPAPLLLESGWNDDLFPPSQSLRVYGDLRARDPGADVALLFGDVGHARASNKETVNEGFNDLTSSFFAKHLLGRADGAPAPGSVTTYTTTCPARGTDAAADGGPYVASDWRALSPGAVSFGSAPAQTVLSGGGDPQTGIAYDGIAQSPSDGCKTVPAERSAGTARYSHESRGFTLMGLPTISARIETDGAGGQLAARLWDVSPAGKQLLVSRGGYRLLDDQSGQIVFQLHGNGYRFAPGHEAVLELLGRDAPYYRPSNGAFSVRVSDVTVKLPVAEAPLSTPEILPASGRPPRCQGRRATLVASPEAKRLRGTPGADVIVAVGGVQTRILGLGGRDRICGGRAADALAGGGGADVVRGGSGADRLRGGPGGDLVHGGPGADLIRGGPGRDRLLGGPGRDLRQR